MKSLHAGAIAVGSWYLMVAPRTLILAMRDHEQALRLDPELREHSESNEACPNASAVKGLHPQSESPFHRAAGY